MSIALRSGSEAATAARAVGSGRVFVEGIALWAPLLPGWDAARAILRGETRPSAGSAAAAAARPAPSVLAPTERRRAPDTVAVALEVASAACESSGRASSGLPSVFASTFGDTGVSDYLCGQLARAPLETSPTKFHNSVHNAAAGYWAIATGCPEPYTAITAHRHTFGAGLALACTHALADEAAILYVAYDIETPGPLATMSPSRAVLGAAVVLAAVPSPRTLARLDLRVEEGEVRATQARAGNAALVEGNAMASCLPLFEALADAVPREVVLTLAPRLALRVALGFEVASAG